MDILSEGMKTIMEHRTVFLKGADKPNDKPTKRGSTDEAINQDDQESKHGSTGDSVASD